MGAVKYFVHTQGAGLYVVARLLRQQARALLLVRLTASCLRFPTLATVAGDKTSEDDVPNRIIRLYELRVLIRFVMSHTLRHDTARHGSYPCSYVSI